MTEKEKMLAHQMYDANYNKELHDERIAAKELCWEYNQLRPSNEEGQRAVLKKLLGKTGENFNIAVLVRLWLQHRTGRKFLRQPQPGHP